MTEPPPGDAPRTAAADRGVALALGERLRERRAARGLSLRELARRLAVSPSLVSQIETGKIHPSVRTLYAMVSELGMSLDGVFAAAGHPRLPANVEDDRLLAARPAPARPGDIVQRGEQRRSIDLETGVRWERLTTRDEYDIEFLYGVYPPGSESAPSDRLGRYNCREFGLVLTGRLSVTVGFDTYVLAPGDSVFFESTDPHRLYNDGDDVVTAVWVVLGRQR